MAVTKFTDAIGQEILEGDIILHASHPNRALLLRLYKVVGFTAKMLKVERCTKLGKITGTQGSAESIRGHNSVVITRQLDVRPEGGFRTQETMLNE